MQEVSTLGMDSQLHIRLKNCLQTILELEPDMDALWERANFRTDMEMLRDYLSRAETMELAEEDVLRLERATAHFLDELRFPLTHGRQGMGRTRILQ